MSAITREELNIASDIVSAWVNDDSKNYAALADDLRKADIIEQTVGVILLELMSATKLSDWKMVLSSLAGRELAQQPDEQLQVAESIQNRSPWTYAYERWEARYRNAGDDDWLMGREPLVDVVKAVRYFYHFSNKPQGYAVDLGAGDGRNAVYLAKHSFKLTAIDASASAIEILADRLEGTDVELVQSDLAEYVLPQNIDLLVASYIVHLLPEPMKRLQAWADAVVPGGIIMVASRGRLPQDRDEYWYPPVGALAGFFSMIGWQLLSVREETEWRVQMGDFRHTAVVARRPE